MVKQPELQEPENENPNRSEMRAFALEEWKTTRQQVHILLEAIWRMEIYAISGVSIYFAWLMLQSPSSIYYAPGAYVPTLFLASVIWRLKVEYGILTKLGEYTRQLEQSLYGRWDTAICGWEHSIAGPGKRPDHIKWSKVITTYRNTFSLFFLLLIASLVAGGLITGHHLMVWACIQSIFG